MGPHRRSTFAREALLIAASAFLPICLLLGFLVYGSSRSALSQAEENARTLALDVVASLDREIYGLVATLEALSVWPDVSNGPSEQLYASFSELARIQKVHFVLRDLNRTTVMTTRAPLGRTYDTSSLFGEIDKAALETGRPQVSNVFVGQITGARNVQVVVATPRTPPYRYILAASLDESYFEEMLPRIQGSSGRSVAVVDRSGRFVARYPPEPQYSGEQTSIVAASSSAPSGAYRGMGLSGRQILAGFATSDTTGWRVIVGSPEGEVVGPLRKDAALMGGLVVAIVCSALLMGWRSASLFRSSSSTLLQAAQRMRRGESVNWDPKGIREFDEVGMTLQAASDEIEARYQHQCDMIGELSHRTKNLLAVIQGMANQSSRISSDVVKFRRDFSDRLSGISRSHDLLVKSDWKAVPMEELIRSQLAPFMPAQTDRVMIQGEPIALTSSATQNLGMALYELATNAVKHGALKSSDGRLSVVWLVRDSMLSLHWRETGIKHYGKEKAAGFGSLVLMRITPEGLHGSTRQVFEGDAYEWQLEAPLGIITESAHAVPFKTPAISARA